MSTLVGIRYHRTYQQHAKATHVQFCFALNVLLCVRCMRSAGPVIVGCVQFSELIIFAGAHLTGISRAAVNTFITAASRLVQLDDVGFFVASPFALLALCQSPWGTLFTISINPKSSVDHSQLSIQGTMLAKHRFLW